MIRLFTNSDLPQVTKLLVRVFNPSAWNEVWTYERAHNQIDKTCRSPGFIGFITIPEDMVLAVLFGQLQTTHTPKTFHIKEFFVDPDCQRQGLGTALLNHLEKYLDNLGVYHLTTAISGKSPAMRFYLKRGFVDTGPVFYNPKNHTVEKNIKAYR